MPVGIGPVSRWHARTRLFGFAASPGSGAHVSAPIHAATAIVANISVLNLTSRGRSGDQTSGQVSWPKKGGRIQTAQGHP